MKNWIQKKFNTIFKTPPKSVYSSIGLNNITFGSNQNIYSYGDVDVSNYPEVTAILNKVSADLGRVVVYQVNNKSKDANGEISKILNLRPNPIESSSTFFSKIVYKYLVSGNVYINVERDPVDAKIKAFYVLDESWAAIEALKKRKNKLFLIARLKNGEAFVKPYNEVIHLKKNCYAGTMGTSLLDTIKPTLELLQANDNVIKQQLKEFNNLTGFFQAEIASGVAAEDLKLIRDQFIKAIKDTGSQGIAVLPVGATFQVVKQEALNLNVEQAKFITEKLHKFFGVSEKIINGTANKDEINVYINSVLEPIANSLSQELTTKVLLDSQLAKNEYIYVSTLRIGLNNLEAMAKYAKDMAIAGQATVNEIREDFGLPAYDHDMANIPRANLNTVAITEVSKYQTLKAAKGESLDEKK